MVCLLGQTIKITGGNIFCHIPGLAFLVEIKLVVVRLVIILSNQTGSGGGTKVERRREGLQYLALIQVPLNGTCPLRFDDQQRLMIN